MSLVCHRQLAVPMWTIGFIALALARSQDATLSPIASIPLVVMAAVGITAIGLLVQVPRARWVFARHQSAGFDPRTSRDLSTKRIGGPR